MRSCPSNQFTKSTAPNCPSGTFPALENIPTSSLRLWVLPKGRWHFSCVLLLKNRLWRICNKLSASRFPRTVPNYSKGIGVYSASAPQPSGVSIDHQAKGTRTSSLLSIVAVPQSDSPNTNNSERKIQRGFIVEFVVGQNSNLWVHVPRKTTTAKTIAPRGKCYFGEYFEQKTKGVNNNNNNKGMNSFNNVGLQ